MISNWGLEVKFGPEMDLCATQILIPWWGAMCSQWTGVDNPCVHYLL